MLHHFLRGQWTDTDTFCFAPACQPFVAGIVAWNKFVKNGTGKKRGASLWLSTFSVILALVAGILCIETVLIWMRAEGRGDPGRWRPFAGSGPPPALNP